MKRIKGGELKMSIIAERNKWLSDYDKILLNMIEREKERIRKEKSN